MDDLELQLVVNEQMKPKRILSKATQLPRAPRTVASRDQSPHHAI